MRGHGFGKPNRGVHGSHMASAYICDVLGTYLRGCGLRKRGEP